MAASRAGGASLASRLKAFVDSPTGPKTTHFWGPVANWGFVLAVSWSCFFCKVDGGERKEHFAPSKKKVDGADGFAHVFSAFISLSKLRQTGPRRLPEARRAHLSQHDRR